MEIVNFKVGEYYRIAARNLTSGAPIKIIKITPKRVHYLMFCYSDTDKGGYFLPVKRTEQPHEILVVCKSSAMDIRCLDSLHKHCMVGAKLDRELWTVDLEDAAIYDRVL